MAVSEKQATGKKYEDRALAYLKNQGLKLLTRNFHCRYGEIDLIMLEQNTLSFIEVRYRSTQGFGDATESINIHKQQRIIRAAQHYLQRHSKYLEHEMRFDVVVYSLTEDHQHTPQQEWIRDAFHL